MILRTDGGPQFRSGEMEKLVEEYAVQHVVSSPHHPQSNGHAESAGVKQAKKLVSMHKFGTPEYFFALLAVRNAVVKSRGEAPAGVVLGHELRSGDWASTVREEETPAAAKRAHDRLQETMPEARAQTDHFRVGERVRVQHETTKKWDRSGKVIKKNTDRSYEVEFDDGGGQDKRRNVRFLRRQLDGDDQRGAADGAELAGADDAAGDDAEEISPPRGRGRPMGSRKKAGGPPTRQSPRFASYAEAAATPPTERRS